MLNECAQSACVSSLSGTQWIDSLRKKIPFFFSFRLFGRIYSLCNGFPPTGPAKESPSSSELSTILISLPSLSRLLPRPPSPPPFLRFLRSLCVFSISRFKFMFLCATHTSFEHRPGSTYGVLLLIRHLLRYSVSPSRIPSSPTVSFSLGLIMAVGSLPFTVRFGLGVWFGCPPRRSPDRLAALPAAGCRFRIRLGPDRLAGGS